MNKHSDIGSKLSNILFWDVDRNDIDFDKYATFIIQRVLEYGEFCDWKVIPYRTIEPNTLELLNSWKM